MHEIIKSNKVYTFEKFLKTITPTDYSVPNFFNLLKKTWETAFKAGTYYQYNIDNQLKNWENYQEPGY